jgi:hypothetical protein
METMDQKKITKEQLLHLVFGAMFFVVIAIFAVGLDLASGLVNRIGVTSFTSQALEISSHALLVLDLVLFFVYLIVTSIELVKGMMKND